MRATKAYIASLGTTGLLLAFSASLLVVVGTLFAFNAWPGADIRDAVDSVIVGDDEDPFQLAGPEQVALDAAPAASAVAAAPAGGSGLTGADVQPVDGAGTGGGVFTPPQSPGGELEQPGTLPGGGPGTGGGSTISNESVDTRNATNPLADSTEELTGNVGDTVGQVSPELGNAVTETGQSLSEIVRGLPDVNVGRQGVSITP